MHQMDIQKAHIARKWKKTRTNKNRRTHNRKFYKMHQMDIQKAYIARKLKKTRKNCFSI